MFFFSYIISTPWLYILNIHGIIYTQKGDEIMLFSYLIFSTILFILFYFDLLESESTLVQLICGGPLMWLWYIIILIAERNKRFFMTSTKLERLTNADWPIKRIKRIIFVRKHPLNKKISVWSIHYLRKEGK